MGVVFLGRREEYGNQIFSAKNVNKSQSKSKRFSRVIYKFQNRIKTAVIHIIRVALKSDDFSDLDDDERAFSKLSMGKI